MTRTRRDPAAVVQVVLAVSVGVAAACASWSHVLELAAAHGQRGWLAWVVAACIETSTVSAALEIRRRHRAGDPIAAAAVVGIVAVGVQLAAQIARAPRTPWGVICAAIPAVTFLVLAKFAMSSIKTGEPVPAPELLLAVSEPATGPAASEVAVTPKREHQADEPAAPKTAARKAAEPDESSEPEVGDLLLIGRAIADELAREGEPLNRRNLTARLRERNRSCSSARAGALLKALREAS